MARILICDDAIFMRMTIREAMERAGHTVVGEAEDPDSAYLLYIKEKPDLVTMDLLMKTSGVEGIKKICEYDPKARIIIVSVLNDQEMEVAAGIKAGAKGFVAKPIRREILVAEMDRVLALPK